MNMVNQQSQGTGAKKLTAPKNQDWMSEFSSFMGEDEADSKSSRSAGDNFAELFEASQRNNEIREGEVIDGTVVGLGDEFATIDIGFKCEGLVPLQEFKDAAGVAHVTVGDVISVYVERMELDSGFMLLSKDKAEIIRAWDEISAACEKDQLVEGTVIAKVKGGLSVDIGVKGSSSSTRSAVTSCFRAVQFWRMNARSNVLRPSPS